MESHSGAGRSPTTADTDDTGAFESVDASSTKPTADDARRAGVAEPTAGDSRCAGVTKPTAGKSRDAGLA